MEHHTCDVLVVGGGGAALRAAIAAQEWNPELKVILATKGRLGRSGVTATACSDRMAFHATLPHTPPGGANAWRYHAEDIYRIGGLVSDWDLAVTLAREAILAYNYLDGLGVPFVKKEGKAVQFITDGSAYPRACYTGPETAIHIERALLSHLQQLPVEIMNFTMVTRLICRQGRVIGVLALDTRNQDEPEKAVKAISARTVILATGGAGQVYRTNVYPAGMTGDGQALAYRAGAELVNMEFIQIGLASVKTKLNCSGSMFRALPRLVNERGEEFLSRYCPPGTGTAELLNLIFRKGATWPVTYEHPTHVIDVAVYQEIAAGHRVYLDYSRNPEGFQWEALAVEDRRRYLSEVRSPVGLEGRLASPLQRLQEINPESIAWLRERGLDLYAGAMVEVAPCCQHFQGGVKISQDGQTTLAGLYAVGEVAGGQHGANRPGGNALLDGQVFGRLAGEAAAREAAVTPAPDLPAEESTAFLAELKGLLATGDVAASRVRRELQTLMDRVASVVRTAEGLRVGLEELEELQAQLQGQRVDQHGLAYALENENLFLVAEMILRAALARDESRGPHLRFAKARDLTPLARRDPEWQQYLIIKRRGGQMDITPRTPVRPQL
ncbi:FAD-binding protein [Moorella sp. Hama-1]|uniref:FAD-binding protein n=1 Tax=Moorella sp. Hama-1 TaxID=2138101 RepID=UPI000D646B2D|nr:FAD-binding protein [Moorella sp. Hama-1]BCV22302.1 succinate dehydrogenase [Moorella sp. Hama-1]